jgi:hypothetical protein
VSGIKNSIRVRNLVRVLGILKTKCLKVEESTYEYGEYQQSKVKKKKKTRKSGKKGRSC